MIWLVVGLTLANLYWSGRNARRGRQNNSIGRALARAYDDLERERHALRREVARVNAVPAASPYRN